MLMHLIEKCFRRTSARFNQNCIFLITKRSLKMMEYSPSLVNHKNAEKESPVKKNLCNKNI